MPHLVGWLARHTPDVVCLQETKCEDAKFPGADIEAAGYRWVHHGQKTYNGVALLARSDCVNVARGIPGFSDMANMAAERSPLGNVFTPEHVAGTAVFLASDASAGLTGDIIFVDGGYHATGM